MDGRLRNGATGIGSTALALARGAHCSVAILRGGPPRSVLTAERIAVSVNGSRHSVAAIEAAFREAHLRKISLLVVATTSKGAEGANGLMAPWQRRHPDVPAETVATDSSLFEHLAAQPSQVRMVIIGADEVDLLTTAINSGHR